MERQNSADNAINRIAQVRLAERVNPTAQNLLCISLLRFPLSVSMQELFIKTRLTHIYATSDTILSQVSAYGDNEFDAVYIWHLFEECASVYTVLHQINRVLKLGGSFVCSVSEESDWATAQEDYLSVFNEPTWRKLFAKCGFSIHSQYSWIWQPDTDMKDIPEYQFVLEKIYSLNTDEKIIHTFKKDPCEQMVEPPAHYGTICYAFHNLVSYESQRNILFALLNEGIDFDILVPSSDDISANLMFVETYNTIKKEFPQVMQVDGIINKRYRIAFYPMMPFFFMPASDFVVRYQYGIGKPSYNFDVWSFNFDYILCQSSYDYNALSQYTQVELVGNSKFLESKGSPSLSQRPILLYMPTYGESSSIDQWYSFISSLSSKYEVYIKLHHMTSYFETDRLKKISQLFDSDHILTHADLLADVFKNVDIVITDGSGSIFDALQYHIPVILIDSDFENNEDPNAFSLEQKLIQQKRIALLCEPDISHIDQFVSQYDVWYKSTVELCYEIFPIDTGSKAIQLNLDFIHKLLNNEVDATTLQVNRNKQRYLYELTALLQSKNSTLKQIEDQIRDQVESYQLKMVEMSNQLSLISEKDQRIQELSKETIINTMQLEMKENRIQELSNIIIKNNNEMDEKDKRITNISNDLNSNVLLVHEKEDRIHVLSDEINNLYALLQEKDQAIHEKSILLAEKDKLIRQLNNVMRQFNLKTV
jgi:uncharacterized small protein (DUF1192 family)